MRKLLLFVFLVLAMCRTYAQPSSAASTPTYNSGDVLSLFSDAYTNVSGINWFPNWGQSTQVSDITVDGNTTKQYTSMNYQGVEFTGVVNASSYTNLHLDVYTDNCTAFDVYLINTSPSTIEQKVTLNPTFSGWNSFDIPLTSYTNIALSRIAQIKLVSTPFGSSVVYLDNIVFWKAASVPTLTNFSVPDKYLGDAPFTLSPPTSNSAGAFTYTSSNPSVATVDGDEVTIVGVGTSTITASQEPDGGFDAGQITDNLVVSYAPPSTAAPTPTANSTDVYSLFSGTYTNVSGTNWFPNWGQSTTVSDVSIVGNTTKKLDYLNYQGVEFSSPLDVSAYSNLHVDLWTPNCSSFQLFLINAGGVEQSYTITPTLNDWTSIDIPLSAYTSIDLNTIIQFKFVGTPFGTSTIYLDNIYFWKAAATPTLSAFSIGSKLLGAADFTITPPTSNSTGTFTYTSSNTNVATISGNVVHIVGVGTTTITALQAADDTYNSGSISTSLVVSYPPPSTAAPTPTQTSTQVLSIYSDAYTNKSGTNFTPAWGQSTISTDITISGNNTKRYTNFNYQGFELSGVADASSMTDLHLDFWTPNCTAFDVYLINTSPSKEQSYRITPNNSGWNSIDIPLSAYTDINLSTIGQLKFVSTPFGSGTVYLDNLYFWKPASAPTITNFSVAAKSLGDAAFNLTAPTSTSGGAFSYASSNTGVATISGNRVTIVGVGSTTITATQAAAGGFTSGSITATFVVSYPSPTVAATTPTVSSGNVISLFSNAYTNVSGINWSPSWGQSTGVNDVSIAGNTTKKFTTMNYSGVEFTSNVNASTMTHLHLDIWTTNCTAFDVFLINTSPATVEQSFTLIPTFSGWNSFDIPLSNYTNIALNKIAQMKLSATPFGTSQLFLDNVYFWKLTPTWTGTVSTDWSNVSNWSYSFPPVSGSSVIIPLAPSRQPILSADATVNALNLAGKLDLNGKTITVTGAITGTGTFKSTAAASMVISGTVGTINFDATYNSLKDLTITSGSATLGTNLNLYGVFTPTSGTFNTGNKLTLKSTSASNSAVVGVVGATITGKVTTEKFIPKGLRLFRDLGVGLANAGSIFSNWQESGANTQGWGIQITGVKGNTVGTDATTGLDYSFTGNHSMFTCVNNVWDSVLNTKTTNFSPYQGYRVLIRGDRTGSLQTQIPVMYNNTTLRATGNLVTGNVTMPNINSGANNYSFVANPYLCPVSWSLVWAASSNMNASFWYCDPTFTNDGTPTGYTTYVAYNAQTATTSNPLGKSNMNGYLQPNQAFFVQNAASGTPSLLFRENCKVPTATKTSIFGTPASVNRIALGLYKNGTNIDGAVTVFGTGFDKMYGTEDSKKFSNPAENIAFTLGTTDVAISGYPTPTVNDVLPIHLYQLTANTTYVLRVDAAQFTGNGLLAYLIDNTTGARTLLSGDSTGVAFTVGANTAIAANKFSIGFQSGTLAVQSIALTAVAQNDVVSLKWNTIGEKEVVSYSLERSNATTEFTAINRQAAANANSAAYSFIDKTPSTGINYYRVKAVSKDGSVDYSKTVAVSIGKSGTIAVYPNPVKGHEANVQMAHLATGKYQVSLVNSAGVQVMTSTINHQMGTGSDKLSIQKHLAAGNYVLRIMNGSTVIGQTKLELQ